MSFCFIVLQVHTVRVYISRELKVLHFQGYIYMYSTFSTEFPLFPHFLHIKLIFSKPHRSNSYHFMCHWIVYVCLCVYCEWASCITKLSFSILSPRFIQFFLILFSIDYSTPMKIYLRAFDFASHFPPFHLLLCLSGPNERKTKQLLASFKWKWIKKSEENETRTNDAMEYLYIHLPNIMLYKYSKAQYTPLWSEKFLWKFPVFAFERKSTCIVIQVCRFLCSTKYTLIRLLARSLSRPLITPQLKWNRMRNSYVPNQKLCVHKYFLL